MSPFDARSKTRNLGGEHLSQNILTNFPKPKQKSQFLFATLQLMFSFLRRLGVSDVSAKLVVRIKMNQSDCFSLNCSQGMIIRSDEDE